MSDDGFIPGMFLAVLITIGLHACTTIEDGVVAETYERAVGVCQQHDGVEKVLRPDYLDGSTEVRCVNGVKVVLRSKRLD